MAHVFAFYDFMIDPARWPALSVLCAASTFRRTESRWFAGELANVTGPAEAILSSFLLARGAAVRTTTALRYDRPHNAIPDMSSLFIQTGPTGIFRVHPNTDGYSNAYPRDMFMAAPLLNVLLHDQIGSLRRMVVLDVGCGTAFLLRQLLSMNISAFGVEGNLEALGGKDAMFADNFFGIHRDVTDNFDTSSSSMVGAVA
ncbi:unnamed protein product, partial [Polarella glacialis]